VAFHVDRSLFSTLRERERGREYSRLFGFGPLAEVEPEWREKTFGVVRLRSIRIGGA
jgi:hypothetical protein